MKIIVICLSFLISACSQIHYTENFSKSEESKWIVEKNSLCVKYKILLDSNLIRFSFCNYGEEILRGLPYLPIFPVFGIFSNDTMRYYFDLEFNDNLSLSDTKIKMIINSKDEIIHNIDTNLIRNYSNFVEKQQYNYEYSPTLNIGLPLDSINTLDIYIDSIRINESVIKIEPLRLKKVDRIFHWISPI